MYLQLKYISYHKKLPVDSQMFMLRIENKEFEFLRNAERIRRPFLENDKICFAEIYSTLEQNID